ncbi:Phosphatidylinositol 4-kinase alpha 1 [Vitis vinifera]|uniref:1-phosphatidylinositol 4-kinase n=1 Tax=Vitis vinifera TaxID=29760 RepID=A0A438CDU5_VITVI|nr:Phosphatidylinositol 4-kinase alpha 1 [Vitis vinifera]
MCTYAYLDVHSQGILCITFEHQNWIGILAMGMGQDVRLTGFCHQWVNFMWSFNEVPFRGVADILAINFCRLGGYARSGLLWWVAILPPWGNSVGKSLLLSTARSCLSAYYFFSFYLQELNILLHAFDRASLGWFAYEPEWYDMNNINFAQSEAQSVSIFVHYLSNERVDTVQPESKKGVRENGSSLGDMKDQYHPVWGQMENYAAGREKRKQLLLMLCQHEADRLHVWAQPTNSSSSSRLKISSEKWIEFARTAFSVDPRIALSLASRFPTVPSLKAEVTQLVQLHIMELRCMPEALPYFVTPKAVDENSTLLQQLPHWAACSITQALEFLTPAYKGHPRVMAYVLRVLESYPPIRVTFSCPSWFRLYAMMKGVVKSKQMLSQRLVEGYLLRAAQRSDIFAHILIWHLQGEQYGPELGKDAASAKIYSLLFQNSSFQALLPVVRQRIVDGFTPKALDLYNREFRSLTKSHLFLVYFCHFRRKNDQLVSGVEVGAFLNGHNRELKKIQMEGEDLYLPTATTKLVKGIQVGDDCRQDVLALQVILFFETYLKQLDLISMCFLMEFSQLARGEG